MVNQDAKDFAMHVLSQVLPAVQAQAPGAASGDTGFITRLSTIIPGLDANQFKNPSQWQGLYPKIVDYFSQNYTPRIRATG